MKLKTLSVAAVVAAVGLAGCGAPSQNPAHLTGTVTYKGEKLKGGNLAFYHTDKGIYSASIDKDGRYELKDAPEGEMVVCVDTEIYNPEAKASVYGGGQGGGMKGAYAGGGAAPGAKAGKGALQKESQENTNAYQAGTGMGGMSADDKKAIYTKIPAKYMDKSKTDLRVTGVKGKSTADLELKD